MADSFTKADVERLVAGAVADATKQLQAQHIQALELLKAAASKSVEQQRAEADAEAARAKQRSIREAARKVADNGPNLKYVVGPSGTYARGRHYTPGQVITVPNTEDPKDLPSIEWVAYDPRGPQVEAAPEKKGPLTAAEMIKADAERPKHGVHAPKKGRPSDTEV